MNRSATPAQRRKAKSLQRDHAKSSMLEKFGVPVGDKTLNELIAQIQTGSQVCVLKCSNRVSIFEMLIHGIRARVAYDRSRKEVFDVFRCDDDLPSSTMAL